jgi:hypothetical protein
MIVGSMTGFVMEKERDPLPERSGGRLFHD